MDRDELAMGSGDDGSMSLVEIYGGNEASAWSIRANLDRVPMVNEIVVLQSRAGRRECHRVLAVALVAQPAPEAAWLQTETVNVPWIP